MTTTTVSSTAGRGHLKMTFGMNHSLLTKNLAGITSEMAREPTGEGNAIAWILGHIVFWRQTILQLAGGEPVWQEGEAAGFRGTSRDAAATVDRSWAELLETYAESHRRLVAVLASGGELDADTARSLAQLHCHETYHVGQIAMARRVHGLPGVI